MAEGEKFITQLGLDANELLAGLDGVAQAYEEAGGKLLKTISVIDRVNDANERLSRTVKVLTDNGKILTFVAVTNAEGMSTLSTSIERSDKSVKELTKALKELGAIKPPVKDLAEEATKAVAAQAKLNQVLGETIDLTKFGVAAASDYAASIRKTEEATVRAQIALKSLATTKSPFDVQALSDYIRKQVELNQAEKAALEIRANAQLKSLSSTKSPLDVNSLAATASEQQKLWDAEKQANEDRKTDFNKLNQIQSAMNTQMLGQVALEQRLQDEAKRTAAIKEKTSFTNKKLYTESAFDVKKISEATKANDELNKEWIRSLQTIETGYERIGQALSSEDFTKAVNELHAIDARKTLNQAFPAGGNLNVDEQLRHQQAIQTASRSVASGAISPQEFNQIVQSIQTGTINLQNMSTAATQVANNVTAVKNAAAGAIPQTTSLLLSFQSLVRIFQVQLLHSFFGDLSRGMQSSLEDAVQLQIRISEIKTITQDARVTTDGWTASLRSISDSFGLELLDVAEGAYEAISNQIVNTTTAMGFLSEAANFARATVSTFGQSVNLLSSILNAFNINAIETERVAAILFKTIELGRVRAEDMADTIGATARLAEQAGVSFEEFSASIAVSTIQGVRFDSANTLMRNVLLKLLKPTDEMRQLFKQWGVETGEAAIATFGFAGVLKKFSEELEKGGIGRLAESLQELRAIQGVVTLSGGDFDAKFAATLDKIGGSAAGAKKSLEEYAKAVKLTQDSAGFKFERQQQQFKNVFTVDFGDKFLRELVFMSDQVGGLTESFKVLADSVVAFVRPLVGATVGFTNLLQIISTATSTVGVNANAFVGLSGAVGGTVVAIAALNLASVITSLLGFSAATATATTAIRGLKVALISLGLSNPFTIGLAVAAAAVGFFYSVYSSTQDKIRTLDIDTKNEFLKSIEVVQKAREAAAAADLASTRRVLAEKLQSHNRALVPVTKEFNALIANTVVEVDDLIDRLKGLPTLASLLGTKGEDANLSAEAVAEAFDKVIKRVAKDIEKSLNLSDKLQVNASSQNFKEALLGLDGEEAIGAYIKKYEVLLDRAREAGTVGANGLVKDAEAARSNYSEANDILEEISSKRFDLFKETKKSIEDSLKLTKKLTETFEEKQFERSLEGKSDKTQARLLAEKARSVRQEANKLAESGDYEGARAKFELADTFYDQSIDKSNALNKKKKGRGRSSETQGLLSEEQALQSERLALEEKFRKEQEEKQKRNETDSDYDRDARQELLEEQLKLEEDYRKGLDNQLKKQNEILTSAKEFKKASEELLATQKELTAELERQAELKSSSEKNRSGALTDFYGAAAQYSQSHSIRDLGVLDTTGDVKKVERSLNEIPGLIEKAKEIENNKNLPDKDRYKQVEGIRNQIKDRIAIGQDYDAKYGTDKEQRKIGDVTQRELEARIGESSDKAILATRDAVDSSTAYDKLKASLDTIEKATLAATEAKTQETDVVKKTIAAMEAMNKSIEEMNARIREANTTLPPDQQKSQLTPLPIPAHAAGGLLGGPSPSGPGDNQLIFARTGEFIVNAASTKRFYSQLVAMNNGHMPKGYANGGQVTNNFGGISINVPTGTPVKQTREIASQLRRGLRNRTISLQ